MAFNNRSLKFDIVQLLQIDNLFTFKSSERNFSQKLFYLKRKSGSTSIADENGWLPPDLT
jgi:hypothetical protein